MTTYFPITGGLADHEWDDDVIESEWLDTSGDPAIIERWTFAKSRASLHVIREPANPVLRMNGDKVMVCAAHVYLAFPNDADAVEYRLIFGDETIEL